MTDIKNEFEKYLLSKGFIHYTNSGKPSTVLVYMQNLEAICHEEAIDLDNLEKNIDEILRKYGKGGEKRKQGKENHKSLYKALNAFYRFVTDKNKPEDDSWDDVDPAILSIGFLDSDLLESTLDAAAPEDREKYVNNLKKKGFLKG